MRTTAFYIVCILIAVTSLNCFAQRSIQENDSITVTELSSSFFDWYIRSAKVHKHAEYNPVEVQDKNGMTTLDFSTYVRNLKEHSFSDSLLKRELSSYDSCMFKLSKIKYTDYVKLDDLGDFEDLEDDFTNYYRWTGGQEMYDRYAVTKVEYTKQGTIVYGRLYDIDSTGKTTVEKQISTVFIKQDGAWKILDIKY